MLRSHSSHGLTTVAHMIGGMRHLRLGKLTQLLLTVELAGGGELRQLRHMGGSVTTPILTTAVHCPGVAGHCDTSPLVRSSHTMVITGIGLSIRTSLLIDICKTNRKRENETRIIPGTRSKDNLLSLT